MADENTLVFLGTGASEGVPVIGCNCKVCVRTRELQGRNVCLRTSAYLELRGKRILIDASPDFHWQALRAGIHKIDAIFITHWNHDHCGGLLEFGYWNSLRVKKPRIDIYMSDYDLAKFEMFRQVVEQPRRPSAALESLKTHKFEPGGTVMLGDIRVTAVKTYHTEHSIAFVFEYDDKKLSYFLDSPYRMPKETRKKLKKSDILIMDCTFYKKTPDIYEDEKLYHMTLDDCAKLLKETNSYMGVLNHISHRNLLYDELVFHAAKSDLAVAYDQLKMPI